MKKRLRITALFVIFAMAAFMLPAGAVDTRTHEIKSLNLTDIVLGRKGKKVQE